ncbi:glycosyltransferase, partial [Levilactobacillus fujinensis]
PEDAILLFWSKFQYGQLLGAYVSSARGSKVKSDYMIDDRLSMLTKSPVKFIASVRKVRKLIKKEKIELVHVHSTIAGILMVIYKMMYHDGIPVVFTPHAYFSEVDRGRLKNILLISIERFMNRFFEKVIHVSREEESYALDNDLVASSKSVVVSNGVSKPTIKKKEHSGIVFINVARCSFQKNPQLFIKIATKLISCVPNSKFIWVGDGPLLDECRKRVTQSGVNKKIEFVGYSDNPYEYLAQSDVFFSTARYEGLPFSVLEALSFSMPVMLTNIIGHKELVEGNGFLIDKNDMNWGGFVKNVQNIISNSQSMAEASHKLYIRKFSVEKMVSGIESLYESEFYNQVSHLEFRTK